MMPRLQLLLRRKRSFVFMIMGVILVFLWYSKCTRDFDSPINYQAGEDLTDVDNSAIKNLDSASNNCLDVIGSGQPPIHIALVVGGQSTARHLATLVKSLVFYRRDPIHLHLVVDKPAKTSLYTLFATWGLPQITVSYYPLEKYLVIALDVDVVVASDIAELWRHFQDFKKSQAIGLVENQSEWYLNKLMTTHKAWPALGRGFNTGVMLLWLARLRTSHWLSLWQRIAKKQLEQLSATALADQDIVNAVLVTTPWLLHRLPCQWNVQLSDHAQLERCPLGRRPETRFKIIHWNSRMKPATATGIGGGQSLSGLPLGVLGSASKRRYFGAVYQTFLEYDGNLLRRDLYSLVVPCVPSSIQFAANNTGQLGPPVYEGAEGTHSPISNQLSHGSEGDGGPAALDVEEDCYEMRAEQKLTRRTHLFFLHFNYTSVGPNDVSMVSQLSLDRLQLLEDLARHWDGPMSLAVYVSDAEAIQLLQFVQNSPLLRTRHNIAYHVIYREGQFYPVNHLRNVAMEHAPSEFIFQLDFDFLPSLGLYAYLKESVAKHILQDIKSSSNTPPLICLVVPAFETFQYKLTFPEDKASLLARLNTGEVVPFRHDVWRAGHGATDYTQWKAATKPYQVQWDADYEPYVVVSKSAATFDSRFVGFGWNKVAYLMALDALGFRMLVLPNAFTIHLPHAPSLDVARFRTTATYRDCINRFKVEYIRHLASKHGVRALKYLEFRRDLPI